MSGKAFNERVSFFMVIPACNHCVFPFQGTTVRYKIVENGKVIITENCQIKKGINKKHVRYCARGATQ